MVFDEVQNVKNVLFYCAEKVKIKKSSLLFYNFLIVPNFFLNILNFKNLKKKKDKIYSPPQNFNIFLNYLEVLKPLKNGYDIHSARKPIKTALPHL